MLTQDTSSLWYLLRGGTRLDQGWGVDVDDGYTYIVGNTHSFGSGQDDAILLKVHSETGQFPAVDHPPR
jgi:hypothetical protein